MAGENGNAKALRKNDRKNAKKGPRSIASDPDAFTESGKKSKLHHSKGKKPKK